MFFGIEKFNYNLELTVFLNLLIFILILIGIPMIFMGIMSAFKIKPSSKKSIYLYTFSTGMFLMIGSAGFLKEGYIQLEIWFHKQGPQGGLILTGGNSLYEQLYIALIVGVSTIVGLGIVILGRYLLSDKKKIDLHKEHYEHDHSEHLMSFGDIDNPKAAWTAIIMMLSHRIIDGLILGLSVYQMTNNGLNKANVALIVTFNIHIILEAIIVYYRQLQYGFTKKRSILFNFVSLLLIIPIMFIGAFLGKYLDRAGWVIPAFQVLGGAIIIFMSIFELVPEFIHYRHMDKKGIYITLIIFALSIVFTLILLSFHSHNQVSSIVGKIINTS
ncbi:hypothetical protein PR252_03395 [Metamycoplasma hyosynoviae]|nr:hypothetical protein [Metamycoplasma hyosynoviae]MDC8916072.1 hypothetical protein [Metamycoplasma hyosynoviae]MDI3063683.1 hypothetical protein [Metamycoplasma hyosynoviae]